jgi:Flp pilus assembly protein TadG
MRGTIFSRLRRGTNRLLRDKRGNAMFLTAAAALPVIGLVGSGVDIGRAYMAQLRLQQACDAGVLAGRRAMAGSTYSAAAQAEADKMFDYNYADGAYGSTDVTFTSVAQGASSVSGTATATLPTALMQIFDFDEFDLTVSCAAKLEISNADVMMVLDVTGSMAQTNVGDTINRITALKDATMDFFDTLTGAEMGDGRLRFGVVPYSSSANVGSILYAKNPSWLSDNVLLPSRTPVFKVVWGNATTEQSDEYTDGNTTYGSYSNVSTVNGQTSSTCGNLEPPSDTTPTPSGSPNSNQTAQYVDGNGNRITTYDTNQTYTYYNYRYTWSSSRCRLQRRVATFARTYTTTVTETPTQSFDNKYTYQDRVFDVSQAKAGSAIETDTGDSGTTVSNTWGGCVMERGTEPFGPTEAAPADAHDMDVDSAPTSDDDTKWKVLIPQIAFPRASSPGSTPSTTGSITVNSSSVSSSTSTNGSWQNYSRYWSNGWGVCPAAAMKLTTQTASDRSSFNTYIQSLQPLGGTYHDAGMVWGVRLLSPDGMFADENSTAPNNRPISRHIVFMTDGQMAPNMGNLSFQGYEWLMKRVGGTSDSNLTTRHDNRFAQLCERAKAKNITVWVVSFGVSLNSSLTNCATPGKAYQANNAAQLNENFQAIARQISKLRLSQ